MNTTDMQTPDDAVRRVKQFIAAINSRDLQAAESVSDPNLEMFFPAGVTLTGVAGFFDWLKKRTPVSRYDYDTFHAVLSGSDFIVYASGSATGELASGVSFTAVRVLDRFLIRDGKIVKKEAWSDMGEVLRSKG